MAKAESPRFWINKNEFWRLQNQHLGARPKLFGWIDIKAPQLQGATYHLEQPIYNPLTQGTFTKDGVMLEFRARVMATANIGWIELEATGKPLELEISTQLTDQELTLPRIDVTASRPGSGSVEDPFWLQRRYDDCVDVESGMAAAVRVFDDRGKKVNPWTPLPVKTPEPNHRQPRELAYALQPGETEALDGLKAGMAEANWPQDIFCGEFREGLTAPAGTGNQDRQP